MIGALIGDVLLRSIPAHLSAGVQAGEYQVYGSIIRSLTSGQIVGHLQETSALTNIAGHLLMAPASLPVQGAGVMLDGVGHAASYVQNEQIKAGIQVLQSMQVANLVLGTAAIGVSVAGFAVMSRKLKRIEAKVHELEPQLREIGSAVRAIRADQIAEDFVRLRTALEQLDEGWMLAEPADQWRRVAAEAHYLTNQFCRRAMEVLESGPTALTVAEPLCEALCLAANTRIAARMAVGDDEAARAAASDAAKALNSVGEQANLSESAFATVSAETVPGTHAWGAALERAVEHLRPTVERIRTREAAAAATCSMLVELEARQISGREWLEVGRAEAEAPLLFLPRDVT